MEVLNAVQGHLHVNVKPQKRQKKGRKKANYRINRIANALRLQKLALYTVASLATSRLARIRSLTKLALQGGKHRLKFRPVKHTIAIEVSIIEKNTNSFH